MKMTLMIVLLVFTGACSAGELAIYGGSTVLDGDSEPAVAVDMSNGKWRAEAGSFSRASWIGASREMRMQDVTLTIGAGAVTGKQERISNGANFIIGLHHWIGRWGVSLRHISNGAQIFGHNRYPNTGDNMLLLGLRW